LVRRLHAQVLAGYWPDLTTAEANFTPSVYWHYIGSQYFPSWLTSEAANPDAAFAKLRRKLEQRIPSGSALELPELDFLATQCLLVQNPALLQAPDEELRVHKAALPIDQLIASLCDDLHDCTQSVGLLQETVCRRLARAYDPALALPQDSLELRAKDLAKYGEDVWRTYTKSGLGHFDQQSDFLSNENVLQDSIYPDPIEGLYFEYLVKKQQRALQSLAATTHSPSRPTKKGHAHNKHTSRRPSSGGEEMKGEKPNSRPKQGLTRRKEDSEQHRITSYIQNYRQTVQHLDDTLCQVCNDGDYEESNLIVFCAVLVVRYWN